jgi:transcription antitermination factor NusG
MVSGLLPPPDDLRAWCAVFSRPRCEKKIEAFCASRALPAYLPLLATTHRYGARVRTHTKPLFTGYLFALASAQDRLLLQGNQHTARVLTVADQATFYSQLEQIRRAMETGGAAELLPSLATGTRVEVKQGPLKGVEGVVQHLKSKTRIILAIDFIQQAVAVEIDSSWLIPV